MDAVFKKLNYKDQSKVFIINAPEVFRENMKAMSSLTEIEEKISTNDKIDFCLVFVTTREQIQRFANQIGSIAQGDAVVWFAYPKKSSKKYKSDITRDFGWEILGTLNMEGVRAIAIDEDWTAIRFRKVEYIKNLRRDVSWVMSEEGKKSKLS